LTNTPDFFSFSLSHTSPIIVVVVVAFNDEGLKIDIFILNFILFFLSTTGDNDDGLSGCCCWLPTFKTENNIYFLNGFSFSIKTNHHNRIPKKVNGMNDSHEFRCSEGATNQEVGGILAWVGGD
jgi:hypothetical protein